MESETSQKHNLNRGYLGQLLQMAIGWTGMIIEPDFYHLKTCRVSFGCHVLLVIRCALPPGVVLGFRLSVLI